jgi:hypothetical protein
MGPRGANKDFTTRPWAKRFVDIKPCVYTSSVVLRFAVAAAKENHCPERIFELRLDFVHLENVWCAQSLRAHSSVTEEVYLDGEGTARRWDSLRVARPLVHNRPIRSSLL